jgi:DNA recombination protein RmuC
MDAITLVALILAAAALVAVVVLWRLRPGDDGSRLAAEFEALRAAQSELVGRLGQVSDGQTATQAAITKTLGDRLDAVSKQLNEGLNKSATRTAGELGALRKHLSVIDQAQRNITELTGQVVGLQDILANKQARGAFGEIQLNDIVQSALPPSAYGFQVTLSNGKRADCLIALPNPPGPIVIDAKFPLESYATLRAAADEAARTIAARGFAQSILKHVNDIAERYVLPGETAESALMFLPSEAVYAELHANFREVVEASFAKRVWIVSPTTLMATLNTVRAVLKDVRMREQADVIQHEVGRMLDDVRRLDERVGKLQRHFDQAGEDLRQIRTSADKITRKGESIGELQLEDPRPEEVLEAPLDSLPGSG